MSPGVEVGVFLRGVGLGVGLGIQLVSANRPTQTVTPRCFNAGIGNLLFVTILV
jgi:hypothetical protein